MPILDVEVVGSVPDALAAGVRRLTGAIAAACGRPEENVHLVYEPPAKGRIAFGGELRR